MQKIYSIGQLREAIKDLDDNDAVVIETTDLESGDAQDLYPFYIDIIDGIKLEGGSEIKEIRFCQMNNVPTFRILSPDGLDIRMDKYEYKEDELENELKEFVKRYEKQGYYSMSNREEIPLKDIADYCQVVPC
jgi:hypothetical protein